MALNRWEFIKNPFTSATIRLDKEKMLTHSTTFDHQSFILPQSKDYKILALVGSHGVLHNFEVYTGRVVPPPAMSFQM